MAGKEDPVRNLGAVSGGSAPAEKEAAAPEGVKVGSVSSASMLRPLPAGRHKRGEKKVDLVYGGLRRCSGSRTPTEEEKQVEADLVSLGLRPCSGGHTPAGEEDKADWVSRRLRPYTGGHTPMDVKADLFSGGLKASSASNVLAKEEDKEKDAVTSVKRKAEGPEGEGGKPAALPAADEISEAAGAVDSKTPEIKWVEMPLEYIAWLLSQKREDYRVCTLEDHCLYRSNATNDTDGDLSQEELDRRHRQRELILKVQATDEAGREEFFEFQEWVRETFERNGRVMVPEGFDGPNPGGIQDVIDEEWEKGRHQLE